MGKHAEKMKVASTFTQSSLVSKSDSDHVHLSEKQTQQSIVTTSKKVSMCVISQACASQSVGLSGTTRVRNRDAIVITFIIPSATTVHSISDSGFHRTHNPAPILCPCLALGSYVGCYPPPNGPMEFEPNAVCLKSAKIETLKVHKM
jgi:hypothetical protein